MSSNSDKKESYTLDFDKIFNDHFDYLVNFACQYVKDSYAAEDICQKVLINLWEKRNSIDPNKSVKSYLFTSVRNRCLNYLRDHQGRINKTLDIDSAAFMSTDFSNLPEYSELQEKINQGLDGLPESCKKTFYLNRMEGKKYKEIAEELNISQKTVEAHISKALKHLRLVLKDYISIVFLVVELFNQLNV